VRDTETPDCETKCGRPAPQGYVCYPCIDEVRDGLAEIEPQQFVELLMIARGEAQPANRNLITNTNTGPGDALNLVVYSLLHDLIHRWPGMLNTLHRDKEAADHIREMRQGLAACRNLTIPSDHSVHDDEYLKHKMRMIRPLQPHDVITYLRAHVGVRINRNQIDLWRHRGLLAPIRTSKRNVYYHPADVLRAMDARERHYDPVNV